LTHWIGDRGSCFRTQGARFRGMAKKRAKRWVETGPLMPWMRAYARWLAGHPTAEMSGTREDHRSRYPTLPVRAARASEYAGRPVQTQLVTLLEKRKDLREYFEKVRDDVDYHTRELAKQEVGENFEIRRAGLHAAAGRKVLEDGTVVYEVEDLKAIEHYTRPYVERGIGKKVERDVPVARYTINLFGVPPEQKRLLLSGVTEPEEPDEVDYEVIETEKTEDGDDD
jgi:hypothetical protein